MTDSRTPRRRPSRTQPGADALEVEALLQREDTDRNDTQPVPHKLPDRYEERTLLDDTPGFTSGTLTEAVPVTHGGRTYRVKSSDTVVSIAKKHGVSIPALVELNNLHGGMVRPGQILSLPEKNIAPPPASHRVRPGDSLVSIALKYSTTVEAIMRANAMTSEHIVVGETLMLQGSGATSSRQRPALNQRLPKLPTKHGDNEYPASVHAAARFNKWLLSTRPAPRQEWVYSTLTRLASEIGVNPHLALAIATQESGLNHRTVSPANAIGIMQVTPRACLWAASLAGRTLNVTDPADNIVAGLTILKSLIGSTESVPAAIAAYYQGATSIERNGLAPDTRAFVRSVQVLAERFATTGATVTDFAPHADGDE